MRTFLSAQQLPLLATLLFVATACGDVSSNSAGGQQAGSSPVAPSKPADSQAPHIHFVDPIVDFGEVWDVDDMEGTFPFTNDGGETLVISEIKPSCGCTTTVLDPMQYEPGESNAIDVVWKPKGFGPQSKAIYVDSNSSGGGRELLTIRATIKPFIKFAEGPPDFGVMQYGIEHRTRVNLECVDPNFDLLELSSVSPWVRAESMGIQPNGTHAVDIVIDSSAPWGEMITSISASVRGLIAGRAEPVEHEVSLPLRGSLFNRIEVSPARFGVGHVLPGRSFDRTVRLRHVDGLAFNVTKAEVLNPVPADMEVLIEPFKIGVKVGVVLRVKGQSGSYMGLIRARVRFETDIPGEGPHELDVMGIVRE